MDTIKVNVKNVKMIAHRGLSGIETENTCSAFVAAGNRKSYYGIETDVHRTSDGAFVIFHDDNTERVSGSSMIIEETESRTLNNLLLKDIDGNHGRNDLKIPMLQDYIGICKKYDKECILELKNQFSEDDILKIKSVIDEMNYLNRVVFISFQHENLVVLRNHDKNLRLQLLLGEWNDKACSLVKEYQMGVDIEYKALTAELVSQIHQLGSEVNCWTVNSAEDAEKLSDMGVDYITTNILESLPF